MMKVLVITETDAYAGPMAAAFLNDYAADMEAVSAGVNPAKEVSPLVVEAMKECMADLSTYKPCLVADFDMRQYDYVVCLNMEPKWEGDNVLSFVFDAPEGDLDSMRVFRDLIKNKMFIVYRDVMRK